MTLDRMTGAATRSDCEQLATPKKWKMSHGYTDRKSFIMDKDIMSKEEALKTHEAIVALLGGRGRLRQKLEPPPPVGSLEWKRADHRIKSKRRRYRIRRLGRTKVYLEWHGSTASHIDLAIPRAEFETKWYREERWAWKR